MVAPTRAASQTCCSSPCFLFCFNTSQQCFPLTPLQQQPPATSQLAVFFSHTTPAAVSSTSTANMGFVPWCSFEESILNFYLFFLRSSQIYFARTRVRSSTTHDTSFHRRTLMKPWLCLDGEKVGEKVASVTVAQCSTFRLFVVNIVLS